MHKFHGNLCIQVRCRTRTFGWDAGKEQMKHWCRARIDHCARFRDIFELVLWQLIHCQHRKLLNWRKRKKRFRPETKKTTVNRKGHSGIWHLPYELYIHSHIGPLEKCAKNEFSMYFHSIRVHLRYSCHLNQTSPYWVLSLSEIANAASLVRTTAEPVKLWVNRFATLNRPFAIFFLRALFAKRNENNKWSERT